MMGLIFFDDPSYFIIKGKKAFDQPGIESFLNKKGIALFDAATAIYRKKGNASDLHLEIIEATDIPALLKQIPHCLTIAVTGEKSAQTVLGPYKIETPTIGYSVAVPQLRNGLHLYRMPSTSRAYPIALEKKASFYRELFIAAGIPIDSIKP